MNEQQLAALEGLLGKTRLRGEHLGREIDPVDVAELLAESWQNEPDGEPLAAVGVLLGMLAGRIRQLENQGEER